MILSLIVAIVMGLGIAYFAVQNTHSIIITLANYPVSIPVYMVVIGAILIGLAVSFILSLINSFSSFFTLRGKDNAIHKAQSTVDSLRRENQDLKVENARLRGEKSVKTEVIEKNQSHLSLGEKLRQSF